MIFSVNFSIYNSNILILQIITASNLLAVFISFILPLKRFIVCIHLKLSYILCCSTDHVECVRVFMDLTLANQSVEHVIFFCFPRTSTSQKMPVIQR